MIAKSIRDLKVGDRVKHYGDESPKTGVIVNLEATDFRGGVVVIKVEKGDGTLGTPTRRYFDGMSGGRTWEILAPVRPEVAVGDTVKVMDVAEGVVTQMSDDGVWLDGYYHSRSYPPGWERIIEVTKKAPLPWQAGDIVHDARYGSCVRQMDGSWIRGTTGTPAFTNDTPAESITAIVRGGKRV